jgi:hypothetical protein
MGVKEWVVVGQGCLMVMSALSGGLRERVHLLRELGGLPLDQPSTIRGRGHTKLNPERRTLANFRGDPQPSTAQLDYLPDQSQPETSAFTTLLPASLCLVESIFKRACQHNTFRRKW